MIEAYNAGSAQIEEVFAELLQMGQTLTQEETRHVREQLSEEELCVFDLLTRPGPELSSAERDEVKKVAKELLAKLVIDELGRLVGIKLVQISILDDPNGQEVHFGHARIAKDAPYFGGDEKLNGASATHFLASFVRMMYLRRADRNARRRIMAESSKGGESTSEGAGDWLRRFGEFSKTEPLVHVARVITITQETLEAGFMWDILEPVHNKMLRPSTGAEAETVLATFSIGQRRLFGVHMYLSEVHHGGHEYYYRYSGALVWPDALAGLEMIGATAAYEILVESMKRFPEPPSVEFDAREKALEKLSRRIFDDLDDRLYAVENQVDELMQAYVLSRPDEFLWSGTLTEIKHPFKFEVVDNEFKWVPKEPNEL